MALALKIVNDECRHIQFDQLSKPQLSRAFPLIGFALDSNTKHLFEVINILSGLVIPEYSFQKPLVPFGNAISSNVKLLAKLSGLVRQTQPIYCQNYQSRTRGRFLSLMVLEFNLKDYAEWAFNTLTYNNYNAARCAQHLGFHRAYTTLTADFGPPEPAPSD
ncbi:hypothetical protein BJ085DRAFT_27408 [Dimargaris cristalligena]|uniref:Uncharacterized protein n=1 Tax=Dimargaris cristalligena TaxID=215637 RepID=A0A4P9ZL47_9FUNG|nr:hypothetical protein BJ085DRAFT_27408 [Dimargaris cristalligena]|eukprot:RKP33201.1 hypothetical protein BJ085DRAFT_27408 [Dimargaris cristalligena]